MKSYNAKYGTNYSYYDMPKQNYDNLYNISNINCGEYWLATMASNNSLFCAGDPGSSSGPGYVLAITRHNPDMSDYLNPISNVIYNRDVVALPNTLSVEKVGYMDWQVIF